ncbi:MAG: cytochrome B [Hyphomicrobiales bacterium]|nr:MAG: cytochrome B [Hyphomicrobiales bacterium]
MKSRADRYGAVAVSIHWLSAILLLVLLGSGFRAANAASTVAKAELLRLHVPVAIAVLLLIVLRIVWWFAFDKRPDGVPGSPAWQEFVARGVHLLFYVVILGMIASGIGMIAISGAARAIFGGATLPDFWTYPPRLPHGVGAKLLVGLLVLHVAAALYHHFVVRDGLLWRMWFDR